MKTIQFGYPGRRSETRGAYLSALLALGLMACAGWGQTQAIEPVNVTGPARAVPAAAAPAAVRSALPTTGVVPVAATPAAVQVAAPAVSSVPVASPIAAAPAGAATQGVVPVDVSTRPTVPTAAAPAVPATPTAAAAVAPTTPAAAAGTPVATALVVVDGAIYPLTAVLLEYKYPHPLLPTLNELLDSTIKLGVVDGAYVKARAGVEEVAVKLGDIGKSGPQKIAQSGVLAIYNQLIIQLNSRGIIGVFVVVSAEDMKSRPNPEQKPDGPKLLDVDEDIRGTRTSMKFVVVTSVVKEVRTVAMSDAATGERVDNPSQQSIREHSPLQPAAAGAAERNDLLRKDVLDDYVLRLNRYPGRRVDVALSGTNVPGELNLDYLVSENRSWYAFAQVSNTGTSQTADIRERFGYVNNQLTQRDDTLTLDYMTADFSKSHGIQASYELPFMNLERVRYKVYGSWSEYTASDVGQNLVQFTGTGWSVGNELIMNIFQQRELFIDAIAGLKVEESQTMGGAGTGLGLFTEPYLGLRLERATDLATTTGGVKVIGFFTGTDMTELEMLGTTSPTRNPIVLQYDFSQSFFLEPLLDPRKFSEGKSTLAHEMFFSVRGQYAFDNRLVPQAQTVAGGLFSVRGYPESIVAGDSTIIGTMEYRFHIPRIFPVQNDPTKTPFLWNQSFRASPQTVYGRPDWDLIFRAFTDVAQVDISNRQAFESHRTLWGAGVGMELQVKQNFNLRADWGIPLNAFEDLGVRTGPDSSRLHFSATILY
jgi:hypothetical protein